MAIKSNAIRLARQAESVTVYHSIAAMKAAPSYDAGEYAVAIDDNKMFLFVFADTDLANPPDEVNRFLGQDGDWVGTVEVPAIEVNNPPDPNGVVGTYPNKIYTFISESASNRNLAIVGLAPDSVSVTGLVFLSLSTVTGNGSVWGICVRPEHDRIFIVHTIGSSAFNSITKPLILDMAGGVIFNPPDGFTPYTKYIVASRSKDHVYVLGRDTIHRMNYNGGELIEIANNLGNTRAGYMRRMALDETNERLLFTSKGDLYDMDVSEAAINANGIFATSGQTALVTKEQLELIDTAAWSATGVNFGLRASEQKVYISSPLSADLIAVDYAAGPTYGDITFTEFSIPAGSDVFVDQYENIFVKDFDGRADMLRGGTLTKQDINISGSFGSINAPSLDRFDAS